MTEFEKKLRKKNTHYTKYAHDTTRLERRRRPQGIHERTRRHALMVIPARASAPLALLGGRPYD